jgi:hypothetical protein
MTVSVLAKKLGIQPGHKILIIHPPGGYKLLLEPLPGGVQVMLGGAGLFDGVQCFVGSQAEVESRAPAALVAAAPGALVWFCYPKKSSKIKTDISRDVGWDSLRAAGWEVVAVVSIDDTWSALRCRPAGEVKSRRGD